MATFSITAVRLHFVALDLAEKEFMALPDDDPSRASSLDNLQTARQMLGMNPANVRAAMQIFREVRSAFPDYETKNPALAQAIKAAREAV